MLASLAVLLVSCVHDAPVAAPGDVERSFSLDGGTVPSTQPGTKTALALTLSMYGESVRVSATYVDGALVREIVFDIAPDAESAAILEPLMKVVPSDGKDATLVVTADASIPYRIVVAAMDAGAALGHGRIELRVAQ